MIDAAVRDVMLENPVTVPPEMLLRDLVDLFVAENVQGVPVVDAAGKLLGIVTEGDLILQEVEGDIDVPHFVPFLDGAIFFDNTDQFDEQIRKAFAATAGRPDDERGAHRRRPATPSTRPRSGCRTTTSRGCPWSRTAASSA